MTHNQRIMSYNRLQGVMRIVDEIITLYHPERATLEALQKTIYSLEAAQNSLSWTPCPNTSKK